MDACRHRDRLGREGALSQMSRRADRQGESVATPGCILAAQSLAGTPGGPPRAGTPVADNGIMASNVDCDR